jgi:hypothetical protein
VLDPYYHHYHRQVFGIQDWLIAISGISRAIMILGLLLTEKFAHSIYRSEIIKQLFMTRKSFPSKGKLKSLDAGMPLMKSINESLKTVIHKNRVKIS